MNFLSRYLSVITCEDCELLRISNTSYERVVKVGTKSHHIVRSSLFDWLVMEVKDISELYYSNELYCTFMFFYLKFTGAYWSG